MHLFVPEVYEPRTFSLRVEATDREPFEAGVEILPQRKWSVFLVHHSHLDIGYTDTQSSVLQHHLQYLDSVLDLASATDDWPEDAKFRWNVEANWPLLHWMKNRPESDRIRFFDRVREGRIEICALPFSMHTEAYSIDELARQLRFAEDLRGSTTCPYRPPCRPTYQGQRSASLLPWWTRTSAIFPWPTTMRAVLPASGRWPGAYTSLLLARPQRQTPVGVAHGLAARQRVHGGQPGRSGGGLPGHPRGIAGLLAALAERPYPYRGRGESIFGWTGLDPSSNVTKTPYPHDVLHLRVQGVFSDNASPNIVPAEIVREWNEKWAYPHLRLATNSEFFAEAEARLAGSIETYSGDWTDWWVDGIGSCAPPRLQSACPGGCKDGPDPAHPGQRAYR